MFEIRSIGAPASHYAQKTKLNSSLHEIANQLINLKHIEAVAQRCSVKKVFLEIS